MRVNCVTSPIVLINNQNVTSSASGAIVGTLLGYPLGHVVEQAGVSVLRITNTPSWMPSQWSNMGVTLQDGFTPSISSSTPRIIGTTGGALVQEPVNEAVKNSWDAK